MKETELFAAGGVSVVTPVWAMSSRLLTTVVPSPAVATR